MGRKKRMHPQEEQLEYPILQPIYGGKWGAYGDGWAVHGNTQEEALENYRRAEQRHEEISKLPTWYLQEKLMNGEYLD